MSNNTKIFIGMLTALLCLGGFYSPMFAAKVLASGPVKVGKPCNFTSTDFASINNGRDHWYHVDGGDSQQDQGRSVDIGANGVASTGKDGTARPYMSCIGTDAVASISGVVNYSSGYGNTISIYNSATGVSVLYGHLATRDVPNGSTVSLGQRIGTIGMTGQATFKHIHFNVYLHGARLSYSSQYSSLANQWEFSNKLQRAPIRSADYNGDGKDDVMRRWNDRLQVFLSDGSKFKAGQEWLYAFAGPEGFFYTGDFNGDGKDDVMRRWNDRLQVFLSDGTKFTAGHDWLYAFAGPEGYFYVGDFDGDGKDDVMRRWNDRLQVFKSDGTKFTAGTDWLYAFSGPEGFFYTGDFDGDGKDDVMRRWNDRLQVFKSDGTKFTAGTDWLYAFVGPEGFFYVGDFNGDGKDDVMRRWNDRLQVFKSDGSKFTAGTEWLYAFSGPEGFFYVGNYNGDGIDTDGDGKIDIGKDDVMRNWNDNLQVFKSDGAKFTSGVEWLYAFVGPEGFFY